MPWFIATGQMLQVDIRMKGNKTWYSEISSSNTAELRQRTRLTGD